MPFVAAPGVARLDAIWQFDTEVAENTFHYHKGTAWSLADLESLCTTYFAWASTYSGFFSDACGLIKCVARDLSSSTGGITEMTPPAGISGTAAGGRMPNNVTFALKRQTGHAGRKNRGRVYLIGLPGTYITTDRQHIDAAHAAAYAAAYDGLMTAQLSGSGGQEVILHRSDGTTTDVTSYIASDFTLDSQRRRLPDHNRHH